MANTCRVSTLGNGLYHVIVRTVARDFFLRGEEKKILRGMVMKAARFGGIQVITFCCLDNHLHLVVFVPQRRPVSNEELFERLESLYNEEKVKVIRALWEFREKHGRGRIVRLEKEHYINRMYNLSSFVKTFKENFTQSYNRRHSGRIGTVWAGRFKSILLNGKRDLALIVCLYVDLNPVKADLEGVGLDPGLYAWSGIGAALGGDREAMEGILTLGRWVGFASEETTPERATLLYYDILLGKARGRIRSFLETRIRVGEKDRRFAPPLRGKEMTLFEMLHYKLRCLENGRMLSERAEDMDHIRGSHPRKSVLPGYYSANGLRKTVVIGR